MDFTNNFLPSKQYLSMYMKIRYKITRHHYQKTIFPVSKNKVFDINFDRAAIN